VSEKNSYTFAVDTLWELTAHNYLYVVADEISVYCKEWRTQYKCSTETYLLLYHDHKSHHKSQTGLAPSPSTINQSTYQWM